jgi:hypothetical protein
VRDERPAFVLCAMSDSHLCCARLVARVCAVRDERPAFVLCAMSDPRPAAQPFRSFRVCCWYTVSVHNTAHLISITRLLSESYVRVLYPSLQLPRKNPSPLSKSQSFWGLRVAVQAVASESIRVLKSQSETSD